ncbi:Heterokaryon incompatibility [Hyphodiscus hymeniophilus]|uniref:Heterokaryon incompatibility n=1 Tax=Hyphodiscus hymeniophilus TaxID=353542 RepID=A0A9P6VL49_9HELO|nr:Heterokaryon incompatibility [Hyphodiscus hymeniophilus]
MREQRSDKPPSFQMVLEGTWNTSRPSALHFVTAFSPDVVRWTYRKLRLIWQARSSTIQTLFAIFLAGLIAACVEKWMASRRNLREAEPFKYPEEPLASSSNAGRNETRLLRIHRWVPWAGVRTTISPKLISSTPPFEAISYTWGNSAKTHSIIVNGRPLKTTAATYNALYSCSLWYRTRLVWIDYVCINQSNADEKSTQVGLMKEIYSSATRVVVWLAGPPKPTGLQHYVELVMRHIQDERVAVDIIREFSDLITYYGFSGYDLSQAVKREDRSHRVYRLSALSDFLANPWFSRVWIIQEVAVAREITFLYENQPIEWQPVLEVMNSFQEPEMAAALAGGGRNGDLQNTNLFHVLVRIRNDTAKIRERRNNLLFWLNPLNRNADASCTSKALQMDSLLPLSLLLTKCADFNATDPRDKIYSMLGLASDDSPRFIRPDYNKDTRTVYTEAAHYVLGTKHPLALLGYAGIGDRGTSRGTSSSPASPAVLDLPSWVPDWTCPPRATALDQPLHNHYDQTQYYASGFSKPDFSFSDTNILTIAGACVDEIVEVTEVCNMSEKGTKKEPGQKIETYGSRFDPVQIAAVVEWHDTALRLAHLHSPKHRFEVEEAFWRTLIGDMTPSSRPAPAAIGEDYDNWISSTRLVHRFLQREGKGHALPRDLGPTSTEFAIWGTYMGLCAKNRRFCVSRKGFMGMVPPGTREGDLVAILAGAKTPYVLRKEEKGEAYQLVGECYMDEMMDGEMMRMIPSMEPLIIV